MTSTTAWQVGVSAALASMLAWVVPAYSGDLALHLDAENDSLVLREPVKFIITISNPSSEVERIAGVPYWGQNMTHLQLEVTDTHDRVHFRHYLLFHWTIALLPRYRGEPLPPGSTLTTFIYPTMSFDFVEGDAVPEGTTQVDPRFTFPDAGTYRVRVRYFVSSAQPKLWQPPGGSLWSNTVLIHVRPPRPDEQAIMDAYWAAEDGWYICDEHDSFDSPEFDEEQLESVARRYPLSPFAKYAEYALLRVAAVQGRNEEVLLRAQVLERLDPDFRKEEIVRRRALALVAKSKPAEAFALIDRTLQADPRLVDWLPLMWVLITVDPANGEGDATDVWLRARVRGEDRYSSRYRPQEKGR